MKVKVNHRYLLKPGELTCDEYPEVGRFGKTVCDTLHYDQDRKQWLVKVGTFECFVSPEELVQEISKTPKPLTPIQLAILKAACRPSSVAQLTAARVSAGGSDDSMAVMGSIASLLDGPLGKGVTHGTKRVTRAYAEKMGWKIVADEGQVWQKGDETPKVHVEAPYKFLGYLTREKVDGRFMYKTTSLGKEAINESV